MFEERKSFGEKRKIWRGGEEVESKRNTKRELKE